MLEVAEVVRRFGAAVRAHLDLVRKRLIGIVSYLDILRFLRGSRVWGEA